VVRDQIRDKLPYPFEDRGEQSVKNIARSVRVYALRPEAVAELPASSVRIEVPRRRRSTLAAIAAATAATLLLILGAWWFGPRRDPPPHLQWRSGRQLCQSRSPSPRPACR
jgi:adenylate cyclase